MPAGVLSQEKIKSPKSSFAKCFALKEIIEKVRPPKEEPDTLLHDGLSQFERQLIQECRDDGMSDSEIREWMQEI